MVEELKEDIFMSNQLNNSVSTESIYSSAKEMHSNIEETK
jgi:hypothetical protein